MLICNALKIRPRLEFFSIYSAMKIMVLRSVEGTKVLMLCLADARKMRGLFGDGAIIAAQPLC